MLMGVNPWSAAAAHQGPTWLSMLMLLSLMPKAMHGAHVETGATPGKLRASADTAFASGDLEKAVRFLSQAIQLEPENERNHYKRYRAHLRARRYKEALQDLTSSINLDPSNAEKLRQRAKLYVMMGRCRDAADDFRKLQGTGQADIREGMEEAARCSHSIDEAERLMAVKHWGKAKEELDHAIAATEVAPDLLLKRAVCYFHLGDYYAATADSGRAIKLDSGNVDALALRASAYYQLGEFEMAQTHYREALKFDPEHTQCKEGHRHLKKMLKAAEKGKEAADRGQHKEAIEQLKAAVAQDPEHKVFCAPLWVKISKSHQQLKELGPAKQAAEQALRLNEQLEDAHITLSDVLIALEDFDEAVRVLKQAGEMIENSQRIQEALQKAEIAQKQSKEINYYKVLDVERNADTTEIKRAYRTLAKLYHPDKQDPNQSPEDKEKAEREFLKIAQAYEVLSDDELRAKYDRGEDVSGRVQQQDAGHNPFGGAYHFGNAGGFGGGSTHFRFHFG